MLSKAGSRYLPLHCKAGSVKVTAARGLSALPQVFGLDLVSNALGSSTSINPLVAGGQ